MVTRRRRERFTGISVTSANSTRRTCREVSCRKRPTRGTTEASRSDSGGGRDVM
jgi:hypothetical protein